MLFYRFPVIWAIFLLFAMFYSTASYASSNDCYNIQQFEAEQGLRIHSELLVISLTCQKTSGYTELYPKYQRFTTKNKLLLADYENRLINFFKGQGSTAPAKELHTLRTKLANDISKHAINMSVASFCIYFGKRVDRALNMDKETLRRWARQIWKEQKTSYDVCSKDKAILEKEVKERKERRQLLIQQQRKKKRQSYR